MIPQGQEVMTRPISVRPLALFLFCCHAAMTRTVPVSSPLIFAEAFAMVPISIHTHRFVVTKTTCSGMSPKYDPLTKRWWSDDSSEPGYGPIGTLLRQGPVPFLQRIRDPDMYNQGVLKMMAKNKMTRNQAQGNMDAYLQNPNDWILQKLEDKRNGNDYDYENANMEPRQLLLTGIWSTLLLGIAGRVIYVGVNGCDAFCQATHF